MATEYNPTFWASMKNYDCPGAIRLQKQLRKQMHARLYRRNWWHVGCGIYAVDCNPLEWRKEVRKAEKITGFRPGWSFHR